MADTAPHTDGASAAAEPAAKTQQALEVIISYSRLDALNFANQLDKTLSAFGHEPILDHPVEAPAGPP